jgi:carboxyl-terminal processing protease
MQSPPASQAAAPQKALLGIARRGRWQLLVVGLSALVALVLTVSHRGPAMLVGLGHTTLAANQDRKAYNPASALDTFNKTLVRVHDFYVDPTRIDPKGMLIAALESVQTHVAEVMVEVAPDKRSVKVRVDTAARDFSIEGVDAAWSLAPKMAEIFQFIAANVLPGTDAQALRDIEYAATNGMLSTLDPHSVLMDPQTNNEMRTSTRGSFGGLGIVIGIRKDALTVMRPMRNTPAWEAGVRRGDRIVRIGKEPTQNMALQDAVDRLRGDPGTKVEIDTERESEKVTKHLVLTRAEIHVPTVTHRVLKTPQGNIGYIRLSQFSQKSDEEVHEVLEDLHRKHRIRGLLLDLRSDPGGLLEKATRIADEFLDAGTIVTTVGFANKQREEKRASAAAQPRVPMAVLVDGASASASEIVAGALKNLDRAVIIGSRTFGKGSVQMLYDNDDGSALKLTIAQYLTPGDVSIQSVGIMPDIGLEPMRVEKKHLSLFSTYKGTREQDLDAHLTSQNARGVEKSTQTLRYIWTDPRKKTSSKTKAGPLSDPQAKAPSKGEEDDDEEDLDDDLSPEDDEFVEDFVIQYSRDLIANTKGVLRHEILAGASEFFAAKGREQQENLTSALKEFGVDFAPVGVQAQPPRLSAQLVTNKAQNTAAAGETLEFTVRVTNEGGGVAGQVRAQLKSDSYLYDESELVLGRIAPGETRTWTLPIKVPKDVLTRQDIVRAVFFEENGHAPAEQALSVRLTGMAHPRFAYSYQLIDDGPNANRDGIIQPGESVRLRVNVQNVGAGRSIRAMGLLRNLSGDHVLINKGRFALQPMAPKEQRSIDFALEVGKDFEAPAVRVELQVYDFALHDGVTDKLAFKVFEQPVRGQESQGSFTASADADVRTGARADAPVIARLKRGDRHPLTGQFGDMLRIDMEPGRPGFVPANTGRIGAALRPEEISPARSLVWQVTPPILEVRQPSSIVTGETVRLQVTATDHAQIVDAFIVVSNRISKIEHRKVFYRSNGKSAQTAMMEFETDVPVWPGVNVITVVARQSGQVQSSQTVIVAKAHKVAAEQEAQK